MDTHARLAAAQDARRRGRLDEAETLFTALLADDPDLPEALSGLADTAQARAAWALAAARWDEFVRRFPDRGDERALRQRAICFERSGELARARDAYEELFARYPGTVAEHGALMSLQMKVAGRTAALRTAAESLVRHPNDPLLLSQAASIAVSRGAPRLANRADFLAGRAFLRRAIGAAAKIYEFERIFTEIPALFHGHERMSVWSELARPVWELTADPAPTVAARALVLAMRLKLALRDYDGFLELLDQAQACDGTAMYSRLRATGRLLRAPRFPDSNAVKVFGIGLSKTGTTSLATALTILGYHTAHWSNDLTGEILSMGDAFLFDALADTPVCVIFETLYHLFPRSKFIYTVRARPAWKHSIDAHNRRQGGGPAPRAAVDIPGFTAAAKLEGAIRSESAVTSADAATAKLPASYDVARMLTHGVLFRERDGLSYERYDARVRSFFAARDPTRLLEFDLFSGDDWPKLCAFLGTPIPAAAFPWENAAP